MSILLMLAGAVRSCLKNLWFSHAHISARLLGQCLGSGGIGRQCFTRRDKAERFSEADSLDCGSRHLFDCDCVATTAISLKVVYFQQVLVLNNAFIIFFD